MMFIPSTVTHGTSLGVACLIFLYQFKNALGLPGFIVRQSVLEYMYHCFELIPKTNPWSLIMFVISFTGLYLAGRYKPALPHTVIVGVAGVLVGFILKMSLSPETFVSSIDTIYSRYGDLRTSLFQAPVWKDNFWSLSLIGYIFELSFIVLIESYSSARMTYDNSGLHFSQQHEVLGLAVANLVAGATGGFVVSSGISRAMMNISNGATSRTSGVVHLVALLLLGVALTPVVDLMPMPMIAAMQYISAIRQINFEAFSLYWRTNKHAFAVGIASAFFCVVVAPFVGLLLGIVMSMMLFSYELGKGSVEVTIKRRAHQSVSVRHSETPDLPRRATTAARVVTRMRDIFERQAPLIVYRLTGALTFVNAVAHVENLKNMAKPTTNLIINMRYLFSIDFDGTQALAKVMTHLDNNLGRPVVLCCVNHFIKEHLEDQSWFAEKVRRNRFILRPRDPTHSFTCICRCLATWFSKRKLRLCRRSMKSHRGTKVPSLLLLRPRRSIRRAVTTQSRNCPTRLVTPFSRHKFCLLCCVEPLKSKLSPMRNLQDLLVNLTRSVKVLTMRRWFLWTR
jgi:MFS superfamily sulfate permease-like transporter